MCLLPKRRGKKMFSSNQKFEISGEFEQLAPTLEHALKAGDNWDCLHRKEKTAHFYYQIGEDGTFFIHIGFPEFMEPEDGWKEYPFRFDLKIVSMIIQQHLENLDIPNDWADVDGSYKKGFLLRAGAGRTSSTDWEEWDEYCDLSLRPFWCLYAK